MERKYKICPKCNAKVREENYERHMEFQHSPEGERRRAEAVEKQRAIDRAKNQEAKRIRKQNQAEKRRTEEEERKKKREKEKEEGEVIYKCALCNSAVKKKNFAKHMKNQHGIANATRPKPTYPKATMSGMSSSDKKKHLKKLFGREKEHSEDAFDRGVIIHGGAWELGKNRKH